MTKQTTTHPPSLSAINPLIAYEEWDVDTAANVRGALTFIADALSNQGGNPMTQEVAEGASRLIMCCVAAMGVTKA